MACRSFPDAVWKDVFFSGLIILALVACAGYFGPFGPSGHPTRPSFRPLPSRIFSFCGSTRCSRCCRRRSETPDCSSARFAIGFLSLLPFLLRRRREKLATPSRRGAHDSAVAVALGTFTRLATRAVESRHGRLEPHPVPAESSKARSPLERQGALVFQVKQCHDCHSLGRSGRQARPGPRSVALALTQDQLAFAR